MGFRESVTFLTSVEFRMLHSKSFWLQKSQLFVALHLADESGSQTPIVINGKLFYNVIPASENQNFGHFSI